MGDTSAGAADLASERFAERLEHLFAHMYPASQGRPYTNGEVARATGLSTTAIGYLRTGRNRPSLETAARLAGFFGVPLDFFRNDEIAAQVQAELADLAAIRDHRARRILRRSAGLPAAMQAAVEQIIDEYRKAAGLPTDPDDDEQRTA
ncbi:helix-turn-helix transcriptional regulator [Streptomyces sp. NPDC004647]|uniref:helix-turn-helix transcriptional regulator n=1 Tax=Streptomyces sp. NPDC004647 TaxID=3154671 RepID=UPI0033A0F5FB